MSSADLVLDVQQLNAGYGRLTVLRDVSLHIGRGEVVGLLGANGAGKSTLVRAIGRHIAVTSGSIMCGSADLIQAPAHMVPLLGVAIVLENRHLFGEMNVRDNLSLAQHNGEKRESGLRRFSLDSVIELFPILKEKWLVPTALLSGGQQQMVAIARSLLLQPELLVLDEPSTGLAPLVVKAIADVLQTLRKDGMSMLLVEQNAAMAARLTDRAYVLSLGRVVHEIKPGAWDQHLNGEALIEAYLGANDAPPLTRQ